MISVVIPVWREHPETLRVLHARLAQALERVGVEWELILVDDGSDGLTEATLLGLAAADGRVRLMRLDRRSGQETALVTGMLAVRGELYCTMDCDLENRPEDVALLIATLRQGYDLVLGKRRRRQGLSVARRLGSWFFNRAMDLRWRTTISDWGCGFSAGTRELLEVMRERLTQWDGEPLKVGFARHATRWTEVEVTQDARPYGRSGYSWMQLCALALKTLVKGNSVTPWRDHGGPRGTEHAASLVPPSARANAN